MRPECERFVGRMKDICNGTAKLPISEINALRKKWGEEPLVVHGVDYDPNSDPGSVIIPKPTGCGGCGSSVISPPVHIKRPSFIEKTTSFVASTAKWAMSGFDTPPPEVQKDREDACRTCPHNSSNWCTVCGCYLKSKEERSTEACPTSMWLQYYKPTYRKFEGPIKRHLCYHIWPKHPNIWKWNLDELKKRVELFNGLRCLGVATDDDTASLEEVKEYMSDVRIDRWIHVRNNPKIREGATFLQLLECLPNNPNDVTFYGHAKGVRHHVGSITVEWAQTQYTVNLDHWKTIESGLTHFPIVGSFKRYGQFRLQNNFHWHYSGTFFWFRNHEVFSKSSWRRLHTGFFACVEAWPANLFEPHEAGCIFGDDAGDLYHESEFQRKVRPNLADWKKARGL